MGELTDYIGYLFNSLTVEFILFLSVLLLGIGVLLYGNLSLATNIKRIQKIIISASIMILLGAMIVALELDDKKDVKLTPEFNTRLYPPSLSFISGKSIKEFIQKSKNF